MDANPLTPSKCMMKPDSTDDDQKTESLLNLQKLDVFQNSKCEALTQQLTQLFSALVDKNAFQIKFRSMPEPSEDSRLAERQISECRRAYLQYNNLKFVYEDKH